MIPEAYEMALERMPLLREKLAGLGEVSADDMWVEYVPEPAEEAVVGVDGGRGVGEVEGGVLYVVDAVAVAQGDGGPVRVAGLADVNVVEPEKFVEERVRVFMQILETKAGYAALGGGGLVLMDGSLLGNISRVHRGRWGAVAVEPPLLRDLEKMWRQTPLASHEVAWGSSVYALEVAELVYGLGMLLDRASGRLVWVSKRSRSFRYFGARKPDHRVFAAATGSPGYSNPLLRLDLSRVGWRHRAHGRLLRGVVTVFYARLVKGGPVLRFEAPGAVGEDWVRRLLDRLVGVSAAGYPYPLAEAHRRARVSEEEFDRLRRIVTGGLAEAREAAWWPGHWG